MLEVDYAIVVNLDPSTLHARNTHVWTRRHGRRRWALESSTFVIWPYWLHKLRDKHLNRVITGALSKIGQFAVSKGQLLHHIRYFFSRYQRTIGEVLIVGYLVKEDVLVCGVFSCFCAFLLVRVCVPSDPHFLRCRTDCARKLGDRWIMLTPAPHHIQLCSSPHWTTWITWVAYWPREELVGRSYLTTQLRLFHDDIQVSSKCTSVNSSIALIRYHLLLPLLIHLYKLDSNVVPHPSEASTQLEIPIEN